MSDTYPIAEIFYSIQGEGTWTGTPMTFVRLAGCNVGRYFNNQQLELTNPPGTANFELALYQQKKHSICTTFDGTRFLCDTDYHAREGQWTIDAITAEIKGYHVCITGGEPFMHHIEPLIQRLQREGFNIHIETSGTKPILRNPHVWVTCSPKEGFLQENLPYIDEWKFIVGPNTTALSIRQWLKYDKTSRPVYLQAIGGVHANDAEALKRVEQMVKDNPSWRLSAQLHKFLGAR